VLVLADFDPAQRALSAQAHHTLDPSCCARIGRIGLRTLQPLAYDPYARNHATGSFILVDEHSNETVAAGVIDA
jgi:sulfate adenylyltransferase subunit 1